ncbi:MAG: lipoate--protein ligase family protein [Candidatus Bathyarchaeota archaeon]|nr:lipoate--protein ligase family protein [Candidatus Bathyarchaeota archaeon]MDH5688144.1 lipoate--protein ligase family protein [Candidatus Bathyarchaeota archaeon]
MVEEWRFLDTGATDAYYNMALDEAIATARSKGKVPDTIRFFRWKPSAVSIGYFQGMEEEIDMAACRSMGVDYIRRITGGGAVYHDYDGELTYSILVDEANNLVPKDVLRSYDVLCSGLVIGLSLLGIPAEFKPINDIVVVGRKISGNAQTRRMGVVHQHGTILREVDPDVMYTLLKVPSEKIRDKLIKSAKERVTSISGYLGREVGFGELKAALKDGFERALNVRLVEGKTVEYEEELANQLRVKYASREWNFKR